LDGGDIGSDPVGAHGGLVDLHVRAIDESTRISTRWHLAGSTEGSLTVTREMFGTGDDAGSAGTESTASLQPHDLSASKERHLSGILAVALVGSTPAIVVRDAEDGTESPAGSCRHHFECGNLSDSLQQFRV